jgi:hypothetical protein
MLCFTVVHSFLFKSTEHLNASVKIKEMDALNTSDHTLILATVGVDVKRAAPKAAKILTKPRISEQVVSSSIIPM